MTLDQIIALGAMGYTKADIEALDKPKVETEVKPKVKTEANDTITLSNEQLAKLLASNSNDNASEKEKEKEKEKESVKEVSADPKSTTLSDSQFDALLQKLRADGANIDVPKKVNVEERLGEHFKALFGTVNNNEK